MGWQTIDTVRCTRCAVFTPTDDLRRAGDGTIHCVTCGPPPVVDLESLVSEAPRRARLSRSPVVIAGAAVAFTVLASFVAACASQL